MAMTYKVNSKLRSREELEDVQEEPMREPESNDVSEQIQRLTYQVDALQNVLRDLFCLIEPIEIIDKLQNTKTHVKIDDKAATVIGGRILENSVLLENIISEIRQHISNISL